MSKFSFLLNTARKDSRKNRGKLFLFMSSIILGIAALVAINSFNYNLLKDIDRQAATLLGADLAITGDSPLNPAIQSAVDSLPGKQAKEVELLSMAYLPSVDETQFMRVKALEGDFPFYGTLVTTPAEAATSFKQSKSALVDNGVMLQYGLNVGDSIKLGNAQFVIAGNLKNAFGSAGVSATFAPAVYIPLQYMEETGLVQPGSLVDYAHYSMVPASFDIDNWVKRRNKAYKNAQVRMETVKSRKRSLNQAFDYLNYFLNLVALVSLLLGCIGVASSVLIYVKNKISSIAIFRCLGMKGTDAFTVYFLQIFGLGVFGVLIGAALGSLIQFVLPIILSDFLPVTVKSAISWKAILEGLIIGTVITVLFALVPLLAVRNISPLRTLRASFEEDVSGRDLAQYLTYVAIVGSIMAFLWKLTGNFINAGIFTASLLAAFLILFLVSKLIMFLVRKFFPTQWSFVLRQGLANLYRPNNQTQTLLISIGLGTAVLTTLFIVQGLLLENVAQMDAGNQPNMILYGIENSQKEELAKLTEDMGLPLIQQVPIVTMELSEWKGRSKSEWVADSTSNVEDWVINREARVTYRDTVDQFEELLRGNFVGNYEEGQDSIFISLDERYADGLGVDIGDEVVYNVQGTRIPTYVSSIRRIDFRNMQARFFIVFPKGVLEEAPQFQVLVTKTPDTATMASYRSKVVKAFPNVSVVDLGSILQAANEIVTKVSYIIQFMAGFSIMTGLIVLLSSLMLSKYQRIRESVLLRTIGASRNQILKINATEYLLIGSLSAATGILISIVGSYLLATLQLNLKYQLNWWPIILVFCLVVGLTLIIGLLNSREVLNKPPLEVLRNELA